MVNSGLSLTGKLPLNPKKPEEPILKSFNDQDQFSTTTWYNTSKTLMHLFLWKLSYYLSADDVIVNIVDPGYVKGTEGVNNMSKLTAVMAKSFAAVTGRSVEVGASTYVDGVGVKDKESHCSSLLVGEYTRECSAELIQACLINVVTDLHLFCIRLRAKF